MPEWSLYQTALAFIDGMPIVVAVGGLDHDEVTGQLWAKITRNDGKMVRLGGDQTSEVRSKWVPVTELAPMGGN